MAHQFEEVIRRGYAAFEAGDIETLQSLIAEDAVWHASGHNRLGGEHRGVKAILGYFGDLAEATGDSYRITELHDVLANDEHGVSMHRSAIDKDGQTHTFMETLVWHFRDGQVSEVLENTIDGNEYDSLIGD